MKTEAVLTHEVMTDANPPSPMMNCAVMIETVMANALMTCKIPHDAVVTDAAMHWWLMQ